MRRFDYYDYREFAPIAVEVENAVSVCGNFTSHLMRITDIFKDEKKMVDFFMACIAYWSEATNFDGRNRYAVCISKEIAKQFPEIKNADYDEATLMSTYAFTMSAHRYLQNELFKTILYYLETRKSTIPTWLEEMDFIILDDNTTMRFEDYKKMRYGC